MTLVRHGKVNTFQNAPERVAISVFSSTLVTVAVVTLCRRTIAQVSIAQVHLYLDALKFPLLMYRKES